MVRLLSSFGKKTDTLTPIGEVGKIANNKLLDNVNSASKVRNQGYLILIFYGDIMANFMSGLISLAISIVIFTGVFVGSVKSTVTNGSYTSLGSNTNCATGVNCSIEHSPWSATEVALWGTLTLVGVAGLLYGTLNVFGLI